MVYYCFTHITSFYGIFTREHHDISWFLTLEQIEFMIYEYITLVHKEDEDAFDVQYGILRITTYYLTKHMNTITSCQALIS